MFAMSTAEKSGKATGSRRRELIVGEVLDAATELFAVKGYEATSLQDIADAVGVSRPALYHYLSSKEDLLVMLVEGVSQSLVAMLEELHARPDLAPAEKIANFTDQLVRERVRYPGRFRILDRSETVLPEPARTDHLEAKRRILREVVTIIEDGVRVGQFVPVDARTTALSVIGMCNWVAWWARPEDTARVESIAETVNSLVQRMLRVPDEQEADGAPGLVREIRERLDRLEPLL
ncbi:TetR family transcriptional regulator [Tsukamurella sp. PLM1]|nr:TetR family transcriptional regulator [Tsukamurella sp. PLM1]